MAVTRAECRNRRAVEGHGLSVVATLVVELVYTTVLGVLQLGMMRHLRTVHSDPIACGRRFGIILNRHLAGS